MTVRISLTPLSEASHDILKFFRGVLAAIAIIYLGCFGYVTTRRMLYQLSATQILVSTSDAPGDHSSPKIAPHPRGPRLLGRITVPRLDMSAVVNEGVDDDTLSLAIGHIPGTALPGPAGNVAVAAHRDTFFRPLKDIRANDEIDFLTTRGEYRYRVKSMRIVNPEDVEVLKPSSVAELTLITCYPFDFFGHAPKRFVVQATLFSPLEL